MFSRAKTVVSEFITNWSGGLRQRWGEIQWKFWDSGHIVKDDGVSMQMARALYRNDDSASNLGSAFAAPIIDTAVNFMGLPHAVSGDPVDEFVTVAFHDYWGEQLGQLFRNAMRDSRAVVRIRRPAITPLMQQDEARYCTLEVLDPVRVELYYSPGDSTWIEKAICTYQVDVEQDETNPDDREFKMPSMTSKTIREIITPDDFTYWNETDNEWMTDLEMKNTWGFVPLLEVFNEWDDYLEGGQSDLEGPLPFMIAFHDVMRQTLQAHKYHSIPKAKFKVNDLMTFLANNFPESFERDERDNPIPGTFTGQVNWRGNEIIFMSTDEDADFLEAKSVLGDSKTLLEFLLDCICVASSTPRWAFMIDTPGQAAQTAESLPLVKKVDRKRLMFEKSLQALAKMLMVIDGASPVAVPLAWEEVNPQDAVNKAQSLQQATMAIELALQRKLISDHTASAHLKNFIPEMKEVQTELDDAETNRPLELAAPNSTDGASQNGSKPPVGAGQQGKNE